MIRCPACGSRSIGRVGASQYFCGDCCVEFAITKRGFQIYQVSEDGTLVQEVTPYEREESPVYPH